MLRRSRAVVLKWVILAGCLGWAAGDRLERAAAVEPLYVAWGPLPKSKPPANTEPEGTVPQDAVLGEDHEKNIQALQREKLDIVRQRLELLTRACAAGYATQNQVDQAKLDELRSELELQDRPHLRIIALKQIVTLLQRFEDDAKQHAAYPSKPNDVSAMLSAQGKYVGARLGRIQAQITLEKEKLSLEQDGDKAQDGGKVEKPK